jgi:hypothetical protein
VTTTTISLPEIVPADTTPEAALVQLGIIRRMHPGKRLELALQMSDTLHRVVASGVRSRHPDYTQEQLRLAVLRLVLGEKLFREACPGVEVEA